MPISGVLVTCKENCLEDVHQAIGDHPRLEIGDQSGCMLVVVTDTETLADDRAEIDWLASLPGVSSVLVAYTNLEDLADAASTPGENL